MIRGAGAQGGPAVPADGGRSSTDGADAFKPPPPPRLLVGAFWGYVVTAIINLLVGAWTLAFLPAALESVRAGGRAVSTGGVVLAYGILAAGTLIFSATLISLALLLRRGRAWARPALLTVSLLSVAAVVTGGRPAFAVILLLTVAGFLATRAPVGAWLPALRDRPRR